MEYKGNRYESRVKLDSRGYITGPWHPDERKFLEHCKLHTNLMNREIGKALGRSYRSIERKWSKIINGQPAMELENARGIPDTEPVRVTIDEEDNILVVESKGDRITTLDELIEYCKVDLEIWEVQKHIINKWEVGAKFGTKGSEEIVVEPLFQVKAWLIRRRPIPLFPVISPVEITVTKVKNPKPQKVVLMKRALIIPDAQFGFMKSLRTAKLTPFHDRSALDIALQIAQKYHFDAHMYLGDWLDLADWTDKFIRSPNFYWTTQPAVIEAKWWMTQFRLADPEARAVLIEGNHESRMPNLLNKHFKEAFGLRSVDAIELPPLMSIPRIMALHDIDVEWVEDYPNGQVWLNDYIVCEHGPIVRSKSGGTVSVMINDVNETHIIGHTHRVECALKTLHTREGARTVGVWSMGCLCRIDGVVPGKKARQNWQQCVGVVEYFDDGRQYHTVTPVLINNGKAIYNGKAYEARDHLKQIIADSRDKYGDDVGWRY